MSATRDFARWGMFLLLAILLAAGFILVDRLWLLPAGATALSWSPPDETEADEPLEDLAGYNIYCWGDSGRYTNTVRIADPSTTHYVISGLAPGKYQCAVSAFNSNGVESVLSNVVSRTIR